MPDRERPKTKRESKLREPHLLTRKEFVKEMGSVVGGVAIASLAFNSACSSPSNNTIPNSTKTNNAITTKTITSGTPTVTNTITSLPPAEGFIYKTPSEKPPMKAIPGCTTSTATDRKYNIDHLWVKMVAENIVAIGITEKMSTMVDFITNVSLPDEGSKLEMGGFFAYIESMKMDVELLAPVSGTVLQVDTEIYTDLVYRVNGDPYGRGWLVTMKLSNPEEWNKLITPEVYSDLNKIV